MNLIINNAKCSITAKPDTRLLDVLREELRLTGTKEGCGEGECGACSVIVNGKLINSCLMVAGQLKDGDKILTIEGVSKTALGKKIQRSFVRSGAVQCGFCIPGMVMASYALLKANKKPTREDVIDGISGNLCRCTGYKKIIEAIEKCICNS